MKSVTWVLSTQRTGWKKVSIEYFEEENVENITVEEVEKR